MRKPPLLGGGSSHNDYIVDEKDTEILINNYTVINSTQCYVLKTYPDSLTSDGRTVQFFVWNAGMGDMPIQIKTYDSWIKMNADPNEIYYNNGFFSYVIDVWFDAQGGKTYNGNIQIISDGAFNSPITIPVTLELRLTGDFDYDGDVDQTDLATLKSCYSGPTISIREECTNYDLDNDGDIDQVDFGIFQTNYTNSKEYAYRESAQQNQCQIELPQYIKDFLNSTNSTKTKIPEIKREFSIISISITVGSISIIAFLGHQYIWSPYTTQLEAAVFKRKGIPLNAPNGEDYKRVMAAMLFLKNNCNQKAKNCASWYETRNWSVPGTEVIKIYTREASNPTNLLAVAALNQTVLRDDYVTGEQYKNWGIKGIALLLFCEWQHHDGEKNETSAQRDLDNFREECPEMSNIMPNIKHGSNDCVQ